jgi:hypothetical protein
MDLIQAWHNAVMCIYKQGDEGTFYSGVATGSLYNVPLSYMMQEFIGNHIQLDIPQEAESEL